MATIKSIYTPQLKDSFFKSIKLLYWLHYDTNMKKELFRMMYIISYSL